MTKSNHISVGSMQNSQIQQDAQHSSQHQHTSQVDLHAFLEAFSKDIAKLTDQPTAEALRVDIETIRLQTQSPVPKNGVIKECLGSIRNVLEGAAGSVLATYLPQVVTLLGTF
ncbi:hypothetical protein [Pseudomonas coronafaciens]|uniref:hypothetical protein n=1 Tax=Pseudomonas coronafaciens TaxID=53409 RepID=UPI000E3D2683|nr:hypothetical protein [Pseudomonas coronafaciens]RMV90765.1 hypothetical protein ALP02_200103 [Pseudomonas coronafaciens pv. garcae]